AIPYNIIPATDGQRTSGTIEEFTSGRKRASAHNVVANGIGYPATEKYKAGQVVQMVRDRDTAYGIPIWPSGTRGAKYTGVIHNYNAIHIELAGQPNLEGWCTDKMYEAAARLVRHLADTYGVPHDRAHILGHDELGAGTHVDPCGEKPSQCTFAWDYLMWLVERMPGAVAQPRPSPVLPSSPPLVPSPISQSYPEPSLLPGSEPRKNTEPTTAAVLVIDVSGSMGDSWNGGVKIESAKRAALDFIDLVRQEKEATGADHRIAVVGFSAGASVFLPMTDDCEQARRVVIGLGPTNSTNIGAGLQTGLAELQKVGGSARRFMVLLSDGMTNTGLGRGEILAGPVAEARVGGICINTVGFGDPGGIDEQFLDRIAQESGCGAYYYAASGLQVFGAFAQIRHQALGQVIPALSSFGQHVTVLPGASIALGTFLLPSSQEELYVTLGWSEGAKLELRLVDPEGRQVTPLYRGAHLYTTARFCQAIVTAPQGGFWKVAAQSASPSIAQVEYFSVSSTRPGGAAFALPLPVISVGKRTFAVPGGLPTPMLVLLSLAALALALWQAINP
ncbi:MAG: VWA domain-containing protein, partial [Candidatus Bipolaricaulia bacterium]